MSKTKKMKTHTHHEAPNEEITSKPKCIIKTFFPTERVEPNAFRLNYNTIIYGDRADPERPDDTTGIFVYNIDTNSNELLSSWHSMKYYPRRHFLIFSKTRNTLYSVGGMNVKENLIPYDCIMVFNVSTRKGTIVPINETIGTNPRAVLTDNDNHLHIIGGYTSEGNHRHIKLDLTTMKTTQIHSFEETNPNISEQGVLFNKTTNQIYMFGGISFWDFGSFRWRQYDDFWVCDMKLNHDKAKKVICAWYKVADIPMEIISIILSYDGYNWYKNDIYKLPSKIRAFGHILYDDRVIIMFGGEEIKVNNVNTIYYLDLNDTKGWIKSSFSLQKAGLYSVVMMDKDTIYVLPCSCGHQEYFAIKLNKILPETLIRESIQTSREI